MVYAETFEATAHGIRFEPDAQQARETMLRLAELALLYLAYDERVRGGRASEKAFNNMIRSFGLEKVRA